MSKLYLCPMHPEVKQNTPGECSKCGMRLVYTDLHNKTDGGNKLTLHTYMPLIVVTVLILLTSVSVTIKDTSNMLVAQLITNFMIGFFLTFSGFKLLDLQGFTEGYSTYDLLAQKFYFYGYIYPFIELLFGLFMILDVYPKQILLLEILVMGFSGIGVAIKIAKKEKFQCACLGTFLKVPLTWVTLIEDFGMVILAIILLCIKLY